MSERNEPRFLFASLCSFLSLHSHTNSPCLGKLPSVCRLGEKGNWQRKQKVKNARFCSFSISPFSWCFWLRVVWKGRKNKACAHFAHLPLCFLPYHTTYPPSLGAFCHVKREKATGKRRKRARKRAPFSLFTYAFSVVWWSEWNESVRSLTFHLLRFIHTTPWQLLYSSRFCSLFN